MAYHFGLYPDDVLRFSQAEWNRYVFALEEIGRQNQAGE